LITDLVLNPIDSYIFWSELWEIDRRTSNPKIMRANQDENEMRFESGQKHYIHCENTNQRIVNDIVHEE
jgi:hypothetical protein